LQSLQQELDALGRHRATLEDQVLEQMVEAEPLEAELAAVDERRAAVDDRAMAVTAALAEAEAAIDAELAELESRRTAAVDGLDAGLLVRYEKLRSRLKGVGVAKLDGTKCTGCHLALPAAEVEQVRRQARDEGVAICPECDRLLVV
jgi:predicted  nucleic acid-binding Zn-ribbon protein